MLKMVVRDLRLSPLRSVLTSVSMLVGIIAMICSVLVGALGKDSFISVHAQIYGWVPTYQFIVSDADFENRDKVEDFFEALHNVDDAVAVTFSMREDIQFAPLHSILSLHETSEREYANLVMTDVVFTTPKYNQVFNLPIASGRWLYRSEAGSSLEMVVNKEAQDIFCTPYAGANCRKSLVLTPFHVVGIVNDGKDIPTVYLDAQTIACFVPHIWQVQVANIYWHTTSEMPPEQMYSALNDILYDTIGGHLENQGRSDAGDAYDSVLSQLQLSLFATSFLLLLVSVLGQINIGLSSLEQRTHELLIRRAIGASRANIVGLVLGSQLLLSFIVCAVSILISVIIVWVIGFVIPDDSPIAAPMYPMTAAMIGVLSSTITALLGGLIPALKASKLEPALALR